MDIDVSAHGVDVAQAVLPPLAARKPQDARQDPVASREFPMELRGPDLPRRAPAHEHRVERLAGADLGAHDVPAARRLQAAVLLARAFLSRRHRIALQYVA